MLPTLLSNTDIIIIAIYFSIVLAIGIAMGRKTKTGEDLFLAGRTLTWGIIGFSLFASNISSTTIIGLAGAAYSSGISISNFEWMSGVPLLVLAFIFVPIYLRLNITTVPEYLELRYNSTTRKLFSFITIFVSVIVDMAGALYAGALVLQMLFPEISLFYTIICLACFAGFYTLFGGLKAVMYTDILQSIVLIAGGVWLTYILFERFDFSWNAVASSVPEGHLDVVRPLSDSTMPWLGALVGVPLLGFWYWVTNQYVTQRVLAAKSVKHAQLGAIFAGFLKLLPLFIMVMPGIMAISLLPNIERSDLVFPTLVAQMLPVGAVGLVVAGFISAILSSVDSTLNSASTLIVMDFIKPFKPELTNKETVAYGRLCILVLIMIAVLWAPLIADFGGLWSYLQQIFGIIVPPVAVVFLFGVFSTRGTSTAAMLTLTMGSMVGFSLFLMRFAEIYTLHYTIAVAVSFLICGFVYIATSIADIQEEQSNLVLCTWQKQASETAGTPPFAKSVIISGGILIICMVIILLLFW